MSTWRLLIAAACLAMMLGTPLPQIDSDTALFGKIALNILDTGDWFTLRHPNYPDWVVDKPPLTFWLLAASLRVGGRTDTALRLWHILFSLLLVPVVYKIARVDRREEEALLAALLVVSFQQVFYSSMAPRQDVPVTLFLSLAFYAYLRYRRDGVGWWMMLAGLWVALAVLTKGILWLPAFVGIAAVDTLIARWRGERPSWRSHSIVAGAFVFTLVAAPWFLIGVMRQGAPFVHTFLVDENGIARLDHAFLGSGLVPLHGVLAIALAYVPMLMVGMLPWTGLLPEAAKEGWRSLREGPPSLRLAGLWFILFFVVISVSRGDRIIRYLLPCYPPLALLAARVLVQIRSRKIRLGMADLSLPVVGVSMMGAGLWLATRTDAVGTRFYVPLIIPTLALFTLTILTSVVLMAGGRTRQAIAVTVTGSLLAYMAAYGMLMQHWEHLWLWRTIAGVVHQRYTPGDHILIVGPHPVETNFAAFWIQPRVEQVDEATFTGVWHQQRAFALLAPDLQTRLRLNPPPIVLLRTPLGWSLVTNVDSIAQGSKSVGSRQR